MEVSAVEEGETWMTPLVRYLEDNILPEERNEAKKIKKLNILPEERKVLYLPGEAIPEILLRPVPQETARILVELHERDCGSHSSGRSLVLRARRAGVGTKIRTVDFRLNKESSENPNFPEVPDIC